MLELHGDELRDLLSELDGHVQMTVRAFYAEDALLSAVTAGDEQIRRLHAIVEGRSELETRDERIALGQRVAEAMDQRRERDQEALLARLRPLVSDLQVDPPGGDRVALSAQLLVRRDARDALDAEIAQLGAALQGYLGAAIHRAAAAVLVRGAEARARGSGADRPDAASSEWDSSRDCCCSRSRR